MTTVVEAERLWAQPGSGPVQRDMAVRVSDGVIAAVGAGSDPGSGDGVLVMPALVNAHDHGYGLRPMGFGAVDDALEAWIVGLRGRPVIEPYVEAAVAFARMAQAGIGATVHCHNSHNADRLVEEAADVARAAADVGIRVAFSCPIVDRNPWVYGGIEAIRDRYSDAEWDLVKDWQPSYAPVAEQLARVEAVAAAHHSDTFNVQYGPIGPQWCQDETLAMIADASAQTGRRVHMHLLETQRQRAWTDDTYQHGIVAHLDEIGLLSPRLTVAHGVWLTPDECALLAARGVTVAVNTASNLRLRSGMVPVKAMYDAGVRFGIGLDGSAIDDDQDLLRDMRMTWLLHGGTAMEPAVPMAAFLGAAFSAGGVAIDGTAVSGLIPGARADVLCLDYGAMTQDVVADSADVADVLMTRARTQYVQGLMVGGRTVVADGVLVSVDLAALEAELHAQASKSAVRLMAERGGVDMHREHVRGFYKDQGH